MSFQVQYEDYLKSINEKIEEYLPISDHKENIVCEAMAYSLVNGGKRIRPVLTLETCRLCAGSIEDALPLAVALECVHTYSLIHDDLPCMDNDDMRRGKPSCHKKFGEEYALLAGDGLLTYAFEIIASCKLSNEKKSKAVLCLSRYAGFNGMIGGQEIDLLSEGKEIDFEKLKIMHKKKTGCLIRCAVELGLIAGNPEGDFYEKLLLFADYLGLAFQIRDDILDVIGSPEELGKPIGSDKQSDKRTYVSMFGLEEAILLSKQATENALSLIKNFNDNEFLISLTESLLTRKN